MYVFAGNKLCFSQRSSSCWFIGILHFCITAVCFLTEAELSFLYLQLQEVGHCVDECRSEWGGRRQNANSSTWIFKLIPVLKVKRLSYLFRHVKLFLSLKLTLVSWLLGLAGSTVCFHTCDLFMKGLLTPASLASRCLYHCWGDPSFPVGEGSGKESCARCWHLP